MVSKTTIGLSVMLWVLPRPGIKGGQRDKIRCCGPHPLERGVQVITAGKSGEKVYEERGHGLFTMQLLKAFEGYADADQNGVLLTTELAAFLQSRVMRE